MIAISRFPPAKEIDRLIVSQPNEKRTFGSDVVQKVGPPSDLLKHLLEDFTGQIFVSRQVQDKRE
jgi:hypothetical protein